MAWAARLTVIATVAVAASLAGAAPPAGAAHTAVVEPVQRVAELLTAAPGPPFALALSARSDVLQEFEGGPGQIAIHGVGNLGGTPGTAVSHGCVRLANRNVRWLAARIAPGVPVTIRR